MLTGSLMSLAAAILFAVGSLNSRKRVGGRSDAASSAKRIVNMIRALLLSRLWLSGFLISFVGLALQVLAFSKAPILVVQATFGGGIVLLVVVSRAILHEPWHRSEVVGIGLAIWSLVVVTVSLHGSHRRVQSGTKSSTALVFVLALATVGVAGGMYAWAVF